MSNPKDHIAEQEAITARCEAEAYSIQAEARWHPVLDTSGSIKPSEIEAFLVEVRGIADEAIQAHEAKVHDFLNQMARFSLPEEECGEQDVEEYISDLDDERLCGEYAAFMEMVRLARSLT